MVSYIIINPTFIFYEKVGHFWSTSICMKSAEVWSGQRMQVWASALVNVNYVDISCIRNDS